MDRSYLERNATEGARLRALVERLSDDDLARSVDGEWTVAALLAHLAFWDRFVVSRWQRAAQDGQRVPPAIEHVPLDLINDAALNQWRALPPRTAANQALAAAEAAEQLIARLADTVADEIVAGGRMPLLDRTVHWRGHLDEIERVYGRPPAQAS